MTPRGFERVDEERDRGLSLREEEKRNKEVSGIGYAPSDLTRTVRSQSD